MAWREQRWTRCACSGYCGDVAHCSGYCGDGATCGSSAVPAFPPLIISNYGDRHCYLPFHCFHCHHRPSLRPQLICPANNIKCEQGGMPLVTLKGRIQLRSKLFNCLLLPPHYDSLPTQTSDINSCLFHNKGRQRLSSFKMAAHCLKLGCVWLYIPSEREGLRKSLGPLGCTIQYIPPLGSVIHVFTVFTGYSKVRNYEAQAFAFNS